MQLKHRLAPPTGTLTTRIQWRDEVVFPVAFGRTIQAEGKEENRTHFGLWFVHPETGSDRFIEAPFFEERRHRGGSRSWNRRWRYRGFHDGALVLSLSRNISYDIGYHIFFFDGLRWTQAHRQKDQSRLLTLGVDHDQRQWNDPGPLGHSYILAGGDLVRADSPTRLAVDYSHAFAYDSGPDTPRSPEYLALCEENRTAPRCPTAHDKCPANLIQPATKLILEEYKVHSQEIPWAHKMALLDNDIWVTIPFEDNTGFKELLLIEI